MSPCIHSNNVCARVGCLAAFQNRTDFFQDYPEDTCLAAMMTCNECKGVNPIEPIEDKGILEKIDRLYAALYPRRRTKSVGFETASAFPVLSAAV